MNGLSLEVAQLELDCQLAEGKVIELQEMVVDLEDELSNECSYNFNEENSDLLNKVMNLSWHLECIGYDDMTIDKITAGNYKEQQ